MKEVKINDEKEFKEENSEVKNEEEIDVEDEETVEEAEQPKDNEDLKKQYEETIEDLNFKYQRLAADFANYKRRVEKERESIRYMALEKFVLSLLPTLDNFERAMNHSTEKNALYEGIDMIYNNLIKQFEANKIIQIDPLGEDFDPSYHQAVAMDKSGEYEQGKVSEVIQKGYILNDKVIRPATVKVAE